MTPNSPQPNIVSRPPVVVVMGHVDHGKSSLLEAIKGLKITAKESGATKRRLTKRAQMKGEVKSAKKIEEKLLGRE